MSGGGSGYQGITGGQAFYIRVSGLSGSGIRGSGDQRVIESGREQGVRGSGGQGVYEGFTGSGVHWFRGQEVRESLGCAPPHPPP